MKIPFVSEYNYYFKLIKQFVGNKMYILFALTLFVAALDGVGITLLLPLLEVSDVGESGSENEKLQIFVSAFEFLNIPWEFKWVLLTIGGVFIFKGLIKYTQGVVSATINSNLLRDWRKNLLNWYKGLEYQYYTSKNSGHFTNVITAQINTALRFISQYINFYYKAINWCCIHITGLYF